MSGPWVPMWATLFEGGAGSGQVAAAVSDATRGAQIAFDEYQAGTVDYTTVAVAQAIQLSTRQTALNVREQRLLDTASLIGDLGGGWEAGELHDPRHRKALP